MNLPVYKKVHSSQSMVNRIKVLNDIPRERARQEHLHPEELPIVDRYITLGEEMGEVATAIQNGDLENLYDELIQVSALAARMAEQVLRE